MPLVRIVQVLTVLASLAGAQTLPIPPRATNAPTGSEFARSITSLPQAQREASIRTEILAGNVPDFLRQLRPVTLSSSLDGETNSGTIFVTPDYLAVGTDADYFLVPMTPRTAQLIANRMHGTLPTCKMVNAIYDAAELKLAPEPIPPSAAMTTVPVFQQHNLLVRTQRVAALERFPAGTLVAGNKKDVVITPRLGTNASKVAIFGWHQTNGQPYQPLYLGHTAAWVDYSHGIRLVSQLMLINGRTSTVARVLADPKLAPLLSDEGPLTNAAYESNDEHLPTAELKSNPSAFNERISEFQFTPDVRIQINVPSRLVSNQPTLLVLYALPNGNTIEQTVGKKLQPGDDWHFDLQHIGAQTRFLRQALTNQNLVIAYLEASMKSWPAWRRKHGDTRIPELVNRIKSAVPVHNPQVVLTGHSGGGSFTFGYLNAQPRIPDAVVRIAFLDSNYAYETTNHLAKLADWLKSAPSRSLSVLAYHDSNALLDGKPFVSERGGTWGRSHAMLADLGADFSFASQTNALGLRTHSALEGRLQLLLQENPDQKILHTVQVERNGFIHALLLGTPLENQGYAYFGARAYADWIAAE